MRLTERHQMNKDSYIGTTCICPSCGTSFVKNKMNQCFCKTKPKTMCKDFYWNSIKSKRHIKKEWRDNMINSFYSM